MAERVRDWTRYGNVLYFARTRFSDIESEKMEKNDTENRKLDFMQFWAVHSKQFAP